MAPANDDVVDVVGWGESGTCGQQELFNPSAKISAEALPYNVETYNGCCYLRGRANA